MVGASWPSLQGRPQPGCMSCSWRGSRRAHLVEGLVEAGCVHLRAELTVPAPTLASAVLLPASSAAAFTAATLPTSTQRLLPHGAPCGHTAPLAPTFASWGHVPSAGVVSPADGVVEAIALVAVAGWGFVALRKVFNIAASIVSG